MSKCQDILIIMIAIIIAKYLNNYHDKYQHLGCFLNINILYDLVPYTGPTPNVPQDSFMYRSQNGVKSVLLDDDNCDCYSTLSMGHGMCHDGFSTLYGPSGRFGVDLLYDMHCQTPDPKRGLALYFRG